MKISFFYFAFIPLSMFFGSSAWAVKGGTSLAESGRELSCPEKEMRRRTVRLMSEVGPCSGVIVDARTILTAAHCVQRENSDGKSLKTDVKKAGLESIRRFDEKTGKYTDVPLAGSGIAYKFKRMKDDMALISLPEPLPGFSRIRLPLLPVAKARVDRLASGDFADIFSPPLDESGQPKHGKVYAVGFGGRDRTPEEARYYEVLPIDNAADRRTTMKYTVPARKDGSFGEPGDSGGPIFRVRGDCDVELYGVSVRLQFGTHVFTPANLAELRKALETEGEASSIPRDSGPAAGRK